MDHNLTFAGSELVYIKEKYNSSNKHLKDYNMNDQIRLFIERYGNNPRFKEITNNFLGTCVFFKTNVFQVNEVKPLI